MGLFSKKRKVSVEEMAMDMMHVATSVIGKLQVFDDVDTVHAMAVGLGYFYGFLRVNLGSITSLTTANTIINKSITHFEKATQDKPEYANFGSTIRTMVQNASENMEYARKEASNNPFMGVAVLYLNDLYSPASVDISKVDIAERDMLFLYRQTSDITKNIKIVN